MKHSGFSIISFCISQLNHLKNILIHQIDLQFAQSHADLVKGMLFGTTTNMGQNLRHDLKVTGMQHVVSASGFNVGLVVWSIQLLLAPLSLPRMWRSLCLFGSVWSYVVLAGASPSLLRAAVMASVSLVAASCWRQYRAGWGLVVSATMLVTISPQLIESISFQLSVSATAGLVWVLPLLQGEQRSQLADWQLALTQQTGASFGSAATNSPKNIILNHLSELFFVSLAAQSLSVPLVLFHFGEVSTLSLLANVCLLWLTPIITIGAGGWSVLSLPIVIGFGWWRSISELSAFVLSGPVELFLVGLSLFGSFDQTLVELDQPVPGWAIWGWWLVLATIVFLKKYQNYSKKPIWY